MAAEMTLTSCSFPVHEKTRISGEEIRRQLRSKSLELDVRHAIEQNLEEDLRLEPRQMGAETEMRALAEPEMRVAGAGHRKLPGIGEFAFVTVGRSKIEHDLVAGPHRITGNFSVRKRGAPHLHHRRHPPDHLFHGIGNEFRRAAQLFERVGLQAEW